MVAECLPDIQISYLDTNNGKVAVVRDDLLSGGTKQRAAIPFLKEMKSRGIEECVYATPFSGYAQIALALSCHKVGVRCTLFAEHHHGEQSDFTKTASRYATIHLMNNLYEAEGAAEDYVNEQSHIYKIPLGLNTAEYKKYLTQELNKQWQRLCNLLSELPKTLWLPVGSGTLAETFRQIVPLETKLYCVDVKVLPEKDERIERVKNLDNCEYVTVPEAFCESVRECPPIPSNRFYDAKLWRFIQAYAGSNEVWWNVAA